MTITVDTANISIMTPETNKGSPTTFSHTCGADVDLLVVVITIYDTSSSDGVVSGVTYNGDPLDDATLYYDSLCDGHVSIWWMAKPDTGSSYTVEMTHGGTCTDIEAAAVGVEGTVGSFALDDAASPNTGTTGDLFVTWDAVAEDSISFAAALDDQTAAAKVTPQETEIYTVDVGDVVSTEYAIRSSSGSQTMTIADADGDEDWVIVGAGFYEIVGATQYQQSTDGAVTPAGNIVKSSGKILTGITTLTGSISKVTTKTFTGSSTAVGSLIKQAQKIFSGSLTPSGLLATTKVTLISIVGSITASGILVKQAGKMAAGSLILVGTLVRQIAKSFTGSVTATGTLIKQAGKVLLGSLTPSGTLIKQTAKSFIGSITAIGSLVTQKSGGGLFQVVGGVMTMAGTLTKRTGKQTAGIITMTGSIIKQISKNVSGALTAVGTLVKQVGKLVVGSITAVGTLVKQATGFPTPPRRIFAIASENRICSIASENRIYSIPRGVTT